MEAVNATKKHLRGAPPISVSLAPRSYTQCNTGNQFGVQRKSKPAENPHGLKLRCGYGAERTRQRSFKPQSECVALCGQKVSK